MRQYSGKFITADLLQKSIFSHSPQGNTAQSLNTYTALRFSEVRLKGKKLSDFVVYSALLIASG
jgi:hypothetical protein